MKRRFWRDASRQRKAQLVLLTKAFVFQIFSVIMTFVLALAITRDMDMSLSFSAVDIAMKVVLYYVFDVSWTKLLTHFKE